jgi:hypothetical protein
MTDFYDDESAEEHAEVLAKIKTAEKVLRATAKALAALRKSGDDIENISNDAYYELKDMLCELQKDYDFTTN